MWTVRSERDLEKQVRDFFNILYITEYGMIDNTLVLCVHKYFV